MNGKSAAGSATSSGSVPSMADVLKNLGSVKLKSVSRFDGFLLQSERLDCAVLAFRSQLMDGQSE